MLWQRTPVYDPETERFVRVSSLASSQPDIGKKIFRAFISETGFHTNVKCVLVGKVCDRWTILGPAKIKAAPEDHPFFNVDENAYIAVARTILSKLDDKFELQIHAGIETDSNERWELSTYTTYRPKPDLEPDFFPDDSSLDHVEGARLIERNAEFFTTALGVEIDDGIIPGDFAMTVAMKSLSATYTVDDWSLGVTSEFADGQWRHETKLKVPPPMDMNIIEALKFEGMNPHQRFAARSNECPFSQEFPSLADNPTIHSFSVDDAGMMTFLLEGSEIRSCR